MRAHTYIARFNGRAEKQNKKSLNYNGWCYQDTKSVTKSNDMHWLEAGTFSSYS